VRINNETDRAPSATTITICITLLMLIWAVNFLAGKLTLRYIPALTLGSLRIVFAALFMLLLYPVCRRLPIFYDATSPQRDNVVSNSLATRPASRTWRDYWVFAYLGFFGFVVNQICFTVGLSRTNVTHSSIIVGLGPIYTLILALLLRLEEFTWRKATGMLISLTGVVLLASSTGMAHRSPTLLGDMITVLGSIGFAMWVVLGKRIAGKYDPLSCTLWSLIFAALMVLPIAVNQVISFGPLSAWIALPWQAWAGLLFMTLFSSTIAYLFYLWLLRFVEASQLTAFSYLIPVAASGFSILFMGEHGTFAELFGGSLALAGVYWVESGRSNHSRSAQF
jgi:drug/metabolite transporter (DMT)-like permease